MVVFDPTSNTITNAFTLNKVGGGKLAYYHVKICTRSNILYFHLYKNDTDTIFSSLSDFTSTQAITITNLTYVSSANLSVSWSSSSATFDSNTYDF